MGRRRRVVCGVWLEEESTFWASVERSHACCSCRVLGRVRCK
uniref:Uncharacterized protein n=1 Tax=Zea mays TaxID=4577 RepID=B4FFQ9_MAIZE|nr:unknown [Zea mays]